MTRVVDRKNTFILMIFCLLFGCKEKKDQIDLYFLLSNSSETVSSLVMELYWDGNKMSADTLHKQESGSDYKQHYKREYKGKHLIEVKIPSESISLKKEITLTDSIENIFINFQYKIPSEKEIEVEKNLHDLMHGSKLKFDARKLVKPKSINIHIMKGKVVLH